MKPVKSVLFLFVISGVCLGCFDPPDFDDSPKIDLESVSFVNKKTASGYDTLSVTISFRDGDGDLGLDNLADLDSPYHDTNFFANDNGNLEPVSSVLIFDFTGYKYEKTRKTPKSASYFIGQPAKVVKELITYESRNQGFSLPPLEDPYTCLANTESYLNESLAPDTILIWRNSAYLIKDTSKIVDKLVSDVNANEWYYAVKDFFYVNVNERHSNIKVQFFYEDNGTYTEYDFRKENCQTFDGRFTILSDSDRPLEGTIAYNMTSREFYSSLGDRLLKLRVTIMDRAGRLSNAIETEPFRLDDI